MPDEWIVRVHGKEYGPVDADELREWRQDGRLIRENEVREAGSDRWFPAGELPEVFADEPAPEPVLPSFVRSAGLLDLLARSGRIYRRRFWQFLGLTALVAVPSVCAQLSSAAAGAGGNEVDLRTALAGLFNLLMLAASLGGWPIYLAALQVLTNEDAHGRPVALGECVLRGLRSWGRTAALCLLVYGAFFLLIALAFAILAMLVVGPPSLAVIVVALGLLILQVWMFGRVFINFLFWQQAAVLEDRGVVASLRRSKELAHSHRELSWWQRPKGRGSIIASLWCLFATALSIGPEWATLSHYFQALANTHDPQALLQSISAGSHATGLALGPLLLAVVQAIFRPLLGIAFVLIYLDAIQPPALPPRGD